MIYGTSLAVIVGVYLCLLLLIAGKDVVCPNHFIAHLIPSEHITIVLRQLMDFMVFPGRKGSQIRHMPVYIAEYTKRLVYWQHWKNHGQQHNIRNREYRDGCST